MPKYIVQVRLDDASIKAINLGIILPGVDYDHEELRAELEKSAEKIDEWSADLAKAALATNDTLKLEFPE